MYKSHAFCNSGENILYSRDTHVNAFFPSRSVNRRCALCVQVHERAAAAAGAVRDGHVVHPVRGLRGAARLHGPAPLLRGALGPRGVAAARAHVLQPPRPAALPHAAAAAREAAARRRGDQHLRHRVSRRSSVRTVT